MASASTSVAAPTDFLQSPSAHDAEQKPRTRVQSTHEASTRFTVPTRTYQQQYSDMYYMRLAKLKPVVMALAQEAWEDFEMNGSAAHHVDRVLDVRQGVYCWICGTVYQDMPLKPSVLQDLASDFFTVQLPPREKFTDMGVDKMLLEDESGRVALTGGVLDEMQLVTGVVVAVLGSEDDTGNFNVVDIRLPDLPSQIERPLSTVDHPRKVAIVSGLGICGTIHENLETHLLIEYLLGEAGGDEDHRDASAISRLIIAGESLGDIVAPHIDHNAPNKKKRAKKYGYDAAAYNPAPTTFLDSLLSALLPSLPITIIPGSKDPTNNSLPQQGLHTALLPSSKLYPSPILDRGTNPWAGSIDGVQLLGSAGQNLDDVFRYVTGRDRTLMATNLLRWRLIAPTAPDTLSAYPCKDDDPFLLSDNECPHVFFVGNQPRFETRVVEGSEGQRVTIVLVPRFDVSGQLVELDLDSLECRLVGFGVDGERVSSYNFHMGVGEVDPNKGGA